jgi:hypothetical protein
VRVGDLLIKIIIQHSRQSSELNMSLKYPETDTPEFYKFHCRKIKYLSDLDVIFTLCLFGAVLNYAIRFISGYSRASTASNKHDQRVVSCSTLAREITGRLTSPSTNWFTNCSNILKDFTHLLHRERQAQ